VTKNKFGKIQSFSLKKPCPFPRWPRQCHLTVRELAGVTLSLERHLNGVKGSQAELTVSQNEHNGEVMMTDNSSELWLVSVM